MSILLISYDLHNSSDGGSEFCKSLKRYDRCQAFNSMVLLDTGENPAAVRDRLRRTMDERDQLYVVRLHRDWGVHHAEPWTTWLNAPRRSWD